MLVINVVRGQEMTTFHNLNLELATENFIWIQHIQCDQGKLISCNRPVKCGDTPAPSFKEERVIQYDTRVVDNELVVDWDDVLFDLPEGQYEAAIVQDKIPKARFRIFLKSCRLHANTGTSHNCDTHIGE